MISRKREDGSFVLSSYVLYATTVSIELASYTIAVAEKSIRVRRDAQKPRLLPELDEPPNDLAKRRIVHRHDTLTLTPRLGVARQKLEGRRRVTT